MYKTKGFCIVKNPHNTLCIRKTTLRLYWLKPRTACIKHSHKGAHGNSRTTNSRRPLVQIKIPPLCPAPLDHYPGIISFVFPAPEPDLKRNFRQGNSLHCVRRIFIAIHIAKRRKCSVPFDLKRTIVFAEATLIEFICFKALKPPRSLALNWTDLREVPLLDPNPMTHFYPRLRNGKDPWAKTGCTM